jgi:hypothetical protein
MTFIVAASTNDVAIHVADTLLTKRDGSFYADDLVKTTVVHCKDAALLLSYTGLGASIDRKRTDKWLVARLREFNAPTKVFVEIVAYLADALTDTLRRNPALEAVGLTLVINGLGVSPKGVRQQAIAMISNIQEARLKRNDFAYVKPAGRKFSRFFLPPPRWYMSVSGSISETLNISGHRKKIIGALQAAKTQDEVKALLDSLVAMLRYQRTDQKLGKVIGEDCTAVAIGRDYGSTAYFYGSKDSVVQRYPNVVRADFTLEDFEIRRTD